MSRKRTFRPDKNIAYTSQSEQQLTQEPIAVYYRLMKGLQKEIPNESDRKRHIIEKQLYMAEYNKKNCFVVQQIFKICF